MAAEAVEVEVGFDRRGGSEFAQGANVAAWEYQVGFSPVSSTVER